MLRKSLAAKLIFYIGIVLVFTMGFSAYINTNSQRKLFMNEMQQNGVQISQMIEQSLSHYMLTADSSRIQKTLEDFGNSEAIEKIRIFNKEGTIIRSSSTDEIGLSVDETTEACFACHSKEKPEERLSQAKMTRIFKPDNGYRLLGIVNPLYNEPRCFNADCHFHPPDQNVLGVMDILLPLERFDKQIGSSQRQTVLYFLSALIIIAGGMGFLIFLFVNRPISNLILGTRKIAAGDLTYRIGSHHSDEIGVLGKSFDSMTEDLQKSGKEVARWNIKLENEIKKATKKLENANKKLQDQDNFKSNFMRKMEHGLRSHVGIIQSCLSLAFKEGQSGLSTQQLDLVSTAKRRTSMLLEVLDDIAQLSYHQSAGAEYLMEPIHIAYVLHKVLEAHRVQAQQKNISVDIQVPKEALVTKADSEALDEVFSNLVNNAIKYTARNGTVSLSAIEEKNTIKIDRGDTGYGISSEELPKIFNEFFRASNAKAKKIEGTGVGLAIVKEIVEAHHGKISVQSEPGKGSTFTVILNKSVEESR